LSEVTPETIYQRLGGESALRALVQCFYRYMNEWPEAGTVRGLHGADLSGAESKLFQFLSGWLGGPDLYWEEFGHPRLRMRHLPFPIGTHERDQWLLCMNKALEENVADTELRILLERFFAKTAEHLTNRPG
jgi:hemoglobin